jgi:hypothetical protein
VSVEAAIAGAGSTKAHIGVEVHGSRIAKAPAKYSPFSDLGMAPWRGGMVRKNYEALAK